jgi:hypothetical protein
MKSTPLTQGASTLILVVYLLHSLMTSPFVNLLIAIAAGVIAYGFLESYELGVAFAIVVGVGYGLVSQTKFSYETKFVKEGFNTDNAETIIKRVEEIKKEPRGVLASSFAEGFADATTDNSGNEVTATASSTSTSAETKSAPANTNGNAGSGVAPAKPPAAATEVMKKAATGGTAGTSGFTGDSKKDMEFKLGVLPEESKGGYHIDQGTTVMNALNALKPDQIQAMTEDTRKLIETQKNLMSMLGSMKPMLQDGKQMMQNFQEMFGNGQMKM